MRHTLSVVVENVPGVLTRVTSLFARRGYNIDSLAVGTTEDPTLSRITVVCSAADTPLEQITKQIYKLINVTKVSDIGDDAAVVRELALIKVHATSSNRSEIKQLIGRPVWVSIYGNFLRIPDPRVGLNQWVCSVCSRRSVLLRAWCIASSGAVQDN